MWQCNLPASSARRVTTSKCLICTRLGLDPSWPVFVGPAAQPVTINRYTHLATLAKCKRDAAVKLGLQPTKVWMLFLSTATVNEEPAGAPNVMSRGIYLLLSSLADCSPPNLSLSLRSLGSWCATKPNTGIARFARFPLPFGVFLARSLRWPSWTSLSARRTQVVLTLSCECLRSQPLSVSE